MREMHARIPETDTGIRRREQHLRARFVIGRVSDRADEILRYHAQCLDRPHVANRIRPLVCRPHLRAVRHRPSGERHRRKRFDRVTQDVESARRRDFGRHRARVVGIEEAQCRLQPPVRDARLRVHLRQIENADACRLAACAGGGGNRKQRHERTRNGQAFADRRIHVVEKVRRRIRDVQVHRFRGVDRRSAADCDDRIEALARRELDRVQERFIGRLNAHAIVNRVAKRARVERVDHRLHRRQSPDYRIRHDQHVLHAQLGEIHPDLARHPLTETDG